MSTVLIKIDVGGISIGSSSCPREVWTKSNSGDRSQFRALRPGEPFLFKLHRLNNFIVGSGLFGHASIVPISLAWEAFAEGSGTALFDEMRGRARVARAAGARRPRRKLDRDASCFCGGGRKYKKRCGP